MVSSSFLLKQEVPPSPQGKNHPPPIPPPPPPSLPQTKPLGIPARPLPISGVRLPVLDEGTSSSVPAVLTPPRPFLSRPGHFLSGASHFPSGAHLQASDQVHNVPTGSYLAISHWTQQETSSHGSSCGPTTPNGWSKYTEGQGKRPSAHARSQNLPPKAPSFGGLRGAVDMKSWEGPRAEGRDALMPPTQDTCERHRTRSQEGKGDERGGVLGKRERTDLETGERE